MADKISASITYVDSSNSKGSKSITDISPTADNGSIKNLCVGLLRLTTNTLSQIDRIDKTDITAATTKPKLDLMLTAYAMENFNFSSAPNYSEEDEPKLFVQTNLPSFTYEVEWSTVAATFVASVVAYNGKVYFATAKGTTIEETDVTQTIKIHFEETNTTAATTAQLVIGYSGQPTLTIL